MVGKIFGTDGIRCKANGEWMNPLFINKLAVAINKAIFMKLSNIERKKARIIIAKDTRRSGYMIESSLASAFMALGMHVILIGPTPTASLPFLMNSKNAHLGIMISASHNPYEDNGIKIFDRHGKISDQTESDIELVLLDEKEFEYKSLAMSYVKLREIGYMSRVHNMHEQYTAWVLKNTNNLVSDLRGIKLVIDCAHGAGYKSASLIFSKLGADFIVINDKPNGYNINENCGAVHTKMMCEKVIERGAHLGIALDGDADRIAICDEKGNAIDNDKLLALIAVEYKKLGLLNKNTVVANIMSNYGLERYLAKHDISVERTPVGDKYIDESFKKNNFNLGGEKSGHIIFGNYSSSGDGLTCGVVLAWIIKKLLSESPHLYKNPSDIFGQIDLLSQATRNFNYDIEKKQDRLLEYPHIQNAINEYSKTLGDTGGRVLVRKSGTEPKIRLVAEGDDEGIINNILDNIINLFTTFQPDEETGGVV